MGWEWRCFLRPCDDAATAVDEALRSAELEERTDLYLLHSDEVGIKHRGGGGLEVKVRTSIDAAGFEKWEKSRVSQIDEVGDVLSHHARQGAELTPSVEVRVEKWRRKACRGNVAIELTELIVERMGFGGGGSRQRTAWRTVAVEGKRSVATPVIEALLPRCRAQASEGSFAIQGYPAFVVRVGGGDGRGREEESGGALREAQGGGQQQLARRTKRIAFSTDGFSVVVCRHPESGRWLAVNETESRGWWLPAGHVDRGQTFIEAAHAEAWEEAGLRVALRGVLAVEHTLCSDSEARMRIIFFAEPATPGAEPKTEADSESLGAAWMTVDELRAKALLPPPAGLRGRELLHWATHIECGGPIAPIELLQLEGDGPSEARRRLAGAASMSSPASLAWKGSASEAGGAAGGEQLTDKLMTAVESGDAMQARLAALAGADLHRPINAKKWTALHLAAERGDAEILRLLLLASGDANARTHKGRTPLHFAATRHDLECVRSLLLAAADPAAVDADGQTCLERCPSHASQVLELLHRSLPPPSSSESEG